MISLPEILIPVRRVRGWLRWRLRLRYAREHPDGVIGLTHVCMLQNTRIVSSEERVIQDVDPVEISSHVTTPDLVFPEDDGALVSTELSSTSKDSDQNVAHDHTHKRRSSGDSMDECYALLAVPAELEVGG